MHDLLMDRGAVASYMLLAATYGRGVSAAEVQTVHMKTAPGAAHKVKQEWIDYAEALSRTPPNSVAPQTLRPPHD